MISLIISVHAMPVYIEGASVSHIYTSCLNISACKLQCQHTCIFLQFGIIGDLTIVKRTHHAQLCGNTTSRDGCVLSAKRFLHKALQRARSFVQNLY